MPVLVLAGVVVAKQPWNRTSHLARLHRTILAYLVFLTLHNIELVLEISNQADVDMEQCVFPNASSPRAALVLYNGASTKCACHEVCAVPNIFAVHPTFHSMGAMGVTSTSCVRLPTIDL